MEDLKQTYTISRARYAKGMMAVHCKPDGTGWKTVAACVCSFDLNARYSHREQAYIMSPSKARKFEAEMAKVQERRERKERELQEELAAAGKAVPSC